MFKLEENMKFVHVDVDYLKFLHEHCSEVWYQPDGYDRKLYVGILIDEGERKYVIPLTSAKAKHKDLPDIDDFRFLIYEVVKKTKITSKNIIKEIDGDHECVKSILAVLDIKKMIPVKDGYYDFVSFEYEDKDTEYERKYKLLLQKEFSSCLKIIDNVLKKANKLYSKQKHTGKILKYCCDFALLETACDEYDI